MAGFTQVLMVFGHLDTVSMAILPQYPAYLIGKVRREFKVCPLLSIAVGAV